ncbi:Pogo transposable element-like 9, partial [Homarus americanus]
VVMAPYFTTGDCIQVVRESEAADIIAAISVVRFAKASNNSAAAREFCVSEKQVREWKKAEEKLIDIPRTKCALRRGKQQWPELEKLFESVNKNQECHIQKTKIAQKLPRDLESKITCFQWYFIQIRHNHNFPLTCFGNMDETPMNFDMISNRTVEAKGSKTILVKTTGHEKARFTVVLSCMADGTKLKPMIIFKWKTMTKVKFPAKVYVHVHENGWMDEGVRLWLERIWSRRPGGLRKERSWLVWDMFRSHLTEPIFDMIFEMRANAKYQLGFPRTLEKAAEEEEDSVSSLIPPYSPYIVVDHKHGQRLYEAQREREQQHMDLFSPLGKFASCLYKEHLQMRWHG